MIYNSNQEIRAALIHIGWRNEGEADIKGKHVKWCAGDVLSFILFEDKKAYLQKKVIRPSEAKRIYEVLDKVHWGAFITVVMSDNQVIDVQVIADVFADYLDVEL